MGACVSSSAAAATPAPVVDWTGPPRKTNKASIPAAKKAVTEVVKEKNCAPIFIRLAWHDAGKYDKNVSTFPARGGANGSIRFKNEAAHGANKGLDVALTLLAPVAAEHADISFADLFQLAGATAVEVAGGPTIPMKFGRKDAPGPESLTPEGNLPAGGAPWPKGAEGAAAHLRDVFGRMGLSDQEIVALSGAHTLGRAKPSRSGFGKESTKYTKNGPGTPGGSSWCREWLKWDNEYFANLVAAEKDPELLVLDTDACLVQDAGFKPVAEKYAADPKAFDADYAAAHAKLSELGVEWE